MKKLTTLTLLSALVLATAAFADDSKTNGGKMSDGKMDSATSTTKKTKKAKKTTSADKMNSTTDKMQKTDKM